MILYLGFGGKITDKESVLKVLPPGYLLGKLIDQIYYEIAFDEVGRENPVVGRCQVDPNTGELVVVIYPNGQYSMNFLSEILTMQGTVTLYDPARLSGMLKDELLWIVLFPWYKAWSYFGEPKETVELAMAAIEDVAFKGGQPHLVAFLSSEWPAEMLKVQHSWTIHGDNKANCRKGDADAGDMLYKLTTDE